MFKILRFNNFNNTISKTFKSNISKNLTNNLTKNTFFSLNININNNNNINKQLINQQNKTFFKKIFKGKDSNANEELEKNQPNTSDLKLQDNNGEINLEQNNSEKANNGEYEFSHKTETNENEENELDIEESKIFSKEDLQIEDVGFKKTITVKDFSSVNNINKFAEMINFEMKFVAKRQIAKYNELNFEKDLVKLVEEMKAFGFNEKLIQSIFRKKYLYLII